MSTRFYRKGDALYRNAEGECSIHVPDHGWVECLQVPPGSDGASARRVRREGIDPDGVSVLATVTSTATTEESVVVEVDLADAEIDPAPEVPPYREWRAEELRDECRAREIATSGRKATLVKRLEAHDEANPE